MSFLRCNVRSLHELQPVRDELLCAARQVLQAALLPHELLPD